MRIRFKNSKLISYLHLLSSVLIVTVIEVFSLYSDTVLSTLGAYKVLGYFERRNVVPLGYLSVYSVAKDTAV